MSFVDALMAKFKKVDESERNRLRTSRPSVPDKGEIVADNTSLAPANRGSRAGASKSITRLRAFIKKKSPEELQAEDAARSLSNERFTEQALNDMNNENC